MADPHPNQRAFPSAAIDDRFGGMTLLEYWAGQALAGFCSCSMDDGEPIMGAADTAKAAFSYAEAMMAEREKRLAERAKNDGEGAA